MALRAESKMLDGSVGVFLLDHDGPSTLDARGWQGLEFFQGRWEATPDEIAAVVSLEMDLELEVHAVITTSDRTWVVLRQAISYWQVGEPRRDR